MKQSLFFEIRFIGEVQQTIVSCFCERKTETGNIKKNYLELPLNFPIGNILNFIKNPTEVFIKKVDFDYSSAQNNVQEVLEKLCSNYQNAKILDGAIFDATICFFEQEFIEQKWNIQLKATPA